MLRSFNSPVALRTNVLQRLFDTFINGRMAVLGVFAADELPTVDYIQRGFDRSTSTSCCCFIANTDPSTKPGKHWVLFLGERGGASVGGRVKLSFFDSYGMPLSFYSDLHNQCSRLGYLPRIANCNTKQLQSLDSVLCGHYCFLFAFLRAHNLPSFRTVLSFVEKLGRIWGSSGRVMSPRPLSVRPRTTRCIQCCCSFH
jgi:hypothetical protein